MSDSWLYIAIFTGCLMIVGLAVYIVRTLRQIRSVQNEIAQRQASQEAEMQAYQGRMRESLEVIARTMLDDQVELSEACIRLKVLIDNYDPDLHQQPGFAVFNEMYARLEHMPTHQARKDADKKWIRKLDKERFRLEKEYRDDLRMAGEKLLQHLSGQSLH
ncbi:MAG: DUF2489 domain-containing protein [Oleiphilaceae bacterium]|nr:DUF2489 domain-containing protein [Oleiphilaceae bacterium]